MMMMISDWLFLRKFVFDACMFCFIFVSRQIRILNNFVVSCLLCGIRQRWLDICF